MDETELLPLPSVEKGNCSARFKCIGDERDTLYCDFLYRDAVVYVFEHGSWANLDIC